MLMRQKFTLSFFVTNNATIALTILGKSKYYNFHYIAISNFNVFHIQIWFKLNEKFKCLSSNCVSSLFFMLSQQNTYNRRSVLINVFIQQKVRKAMIMKFSTQNLYFIWVCSVQVQQSFSKKQFMIRKNNIKISLIWLYT